MPLNSTSLTSPPAPVLMEHCCRKPWETYLEPLRMAPGVLEQVVQNFQLVFGQIGPGVPGFDLFS